MMKTKLLAVMLLTGGAMFAQSRFSIGIDIGGRGAGYYQPPPSYVIVDSDWPRTYGHNRWGNGYWNRRAFPRGRRVGPWFGNRFDYREDRRGFSGRGFVEGRERRFERDRNFNGQERMQSGDFNQGQTRGFRQNQDLNQNYAAPNQDQGAVNNRTNNQGNRPGNGYNRTR